MLNRPIPKTAKLGFIGLIALMIFAAVVLPMANAKSKTPKFLIKGIVTDAKTGRPIAGGAAPGLILCDSADVSDKAGAWIRLGGASHRRRQPVAAVARPVCGGVGRGLLRRRAL